MRQFTFAEKDTIVCSNSYPTASRCLRPCVAWVLHGQLQRVMCTTHGAAAECNPRGVGRPCWKSGAEGTLIAWSSNLKRMRVLPRVAGYWWEQRHEWAQMASLDILVRFFAE
eukprot:scaffold193833_cov16-Tisochrysis_lutea.AAC.1